MAIKRHVTKPITYYAYATFKAKAAFKINAINEVHAENLAAQIICNADISKDNIYRCDDIHIFKILKGN
ncbi:hypothetical protein [Limnohabitans parvus]|uniref:Uncharacterized protein n=1 Tax=Limnohabitans parvus II-B4 TaxID=1293052 RepID=A0A315EIC5_9BURK|nr:hypothetical protein [Limnohabitans parvus]PUE55802.1 hypothetical protein B9Z37_04495 [Limnohabitans parvus II-B4]